MPATPDRPPEYHRFSHNAQQVRDLQDRLSIEPGMPPAVLEELDKIARKLQDHAGSFLPVITGKLGALDGS